MKTRILLTIVIVILSFGLFAATHTVDPSMTTPTIQGIITSASAGDIIEFEDGTYNLTACINISNGVTLISQNGASSSIIDGGNSVRCFQLLNTGGLIDGFTIQHANNPSGHGGGVNIPSGADGTIQNCVFIDNNARDGGGVAISSSGLIQNCIFEGNSATYGGGIRLLNGGVVRNCLIKGNTSSNYGGGLNIWSGSSPTNCVVSNCTIIENIGVQGGGLRTGGNCTIENTIVYNNTGDPNPGEENIQDNGGDFYNICSTSIPIDGTNCIIDNPQFVGANDFHLQSASACIDAGLNAAWMTTAYDLDGNNRIYNTTVDIGCYEESTPIPMTYVPDNNFEQALIDLHYDDVLDDYVVTSNISSLSNLIANNKNISDLTGIEDFTALTTLIVADNQLTVLDLSSNILLQYLYCQNNELTSINLANCTALSRLDCFNNQLTGLDLTTNTSLYWLECHNNNIETINFPNTPIEIAVCKDNKLTSLNLKNTNIRFLNILNNPSLICIEVDDITNAENSVSIGNWKKDIIANFSLDCSIPPIIDTDGDGVADVDDDFPNDPELAFRNKFPSNGYGSLGFEDLWPGKGDYDFNDVVVDYKFTSFSNASNKVVYITAKFIFKATGAYLQNGFGFNLPTGKKTLRADLTVSGSDIQESYIDLKSNGMERGQDRPTIIVCDNVFNLLEHPGSGTGVNTEQWAPFVPFETVTLTMTPTPDTYVWEDFGLNADEWNPFIIVDMERGREVHLKDRVPTSLADLSLLGTAEDDSKPEEDRYYTTVNNLPWAISVPNFDWPRERIEINWAYKHFIEWAESSGTVRQNWYRDRPGFRSESNIYQLPNP